MDQRKNRNKKFGIMQIRNVFNSGCIRQCFFMLCQNVNLKFPKFLQRYKLIFFEHRSNLQELIWITHSRSPGSSVFLRVFLIFNVFNTFRSTWIFYISIEEHFWMNYSFTKWSEKRKKEIVNKMDFTRLSGNSDGF